MRIALVVHKFPPASLGGTETYTENLARELAARGHSVSVFFRDDGDGPQFREGWLPSADYRLWRVGRAFCAASADPVRLFFDTFLNRDVEASFGRFLDEVQPDLVHFQHLMLLSARLPALVKQRSIPMLLTLHDYWFRCANSQLIWPDGQICHGKLLGINCARCATARAGSGVLRALHPAMAPVFQWRDGLVRRAALKVGNFITPSCFLRDRYVDVGFPVRAIEVLENGVAVDRFRAVAPQLPELKPLRVTYLGSLAWQKGVHILVEAMKGLPSDQIRLRVFGNPEAFPDYSAGLLAISDPANTTFEGAVPNVQVPELLAQTDVLAVPSLWYENSPVVIQEAHAAGVPVLASNLGALPEKVRDGFDGHLVAPGSVDAWRRALVGLADRTAPVELWQSGVQPPLSIRDHVEMLVLRYASLMS